MAKVQGKKAATSVKKKAAAKAVASAKKSKKPAPKKPAAKPKPAVIKKAAKRVVPKKKPAPKKATPKKAPKKPAPKKAAPKKAAPKKPAPKKPAPKKAAPKKAASKPAPKVAAKPPAKPVAKPAAKAEKVVEPKAKPAAKVAAAPAPPRVADDKKRRRSRPRVTSNGPATAAWFSQGDKPRSSSFIPAPPRAEAPSLVAAPPASSDRLVGSHELTEFAVRTVPVRIDIEAGGGRIYLTINPNETTLKVGEGIEWDFRYLGGADVVIEEMIIEFAKPSPFTTTVFRSRRPGAARPHRQLSGPAQPSAAGKTIQYTVRAFNGFKTEMAAAKPVLTVLQASPALSVVG
jgi:hypothetical protein